MTFTNNTVTIGKYRVSSARRADDGSVGFILDEGGTLVMKTIPKGAKQPIFSSAQIGLTFGGCARAWLAIAACSFIID